MGDREIWGWLSLGVEKFRINLRCGGMAILRNGKQYEGTASQFLNSLKHVISPRLFILH
ncbi:unnamed protein product [Meloidogyne enterolobii]|uniref:Uncharacterized protein n=1 Tax=Meloidogyne enterolobii TaxID=390850 RepID=A0ACB1B084_MELEN